MTLERASELVKELKGDYAIDLFSHFVDYFDLKNEKITNFAIMCGYPIATKIQIL